MSAKETAKTDKGPWADCIVQRFTYDWQAHEESPRQRQALLEGVRRNIANRAIAHLHAGQDSVLVVATPPGTGKSTAVARLGEPGGPYHLNLAWIAERHDMAEQVEALAYYNHIQRCTPENCPEGYHLHEMLLARGLPTFWLHQRHTTPCAYAHQFHQATSALYQLAHVRTAHPAKHPDGIVIDELKLEAWLEPYEVTRNHILEARASFSDESAAWRLLTAALNVLHEATSTPGQQEFSGQALFAALDIHLGGHLLDVLEALRGDPNATVLYPQPNLPLAGTDRIDVAAYLRKQPPRILAHLWHGLADELAHYHQDITAWNSRLRVGRGNNRNGDWVLYITNPRRFKVADDSALPPRIVLDGTANSDYLRRLLSDSANTPNTAITPYRVGVPDELPPPPGMRHIAVRLHTPRGGIKRYNKSSLTWEKDTRQHNRIVAEVEFLLGRLDADGALRSANRVGLITFKQCEAAFAAAPGIAPSCSGHFFAARGSNALAQCYVLLVVGRPRLPEQQVLRIGSVLYADDAHPLDSATYTASDGTYHFRDTRLEQLDTYLTRAELTQCAHRNRPLIFDARTVVTFCDEPIEYLPTTIEVQRLPAHLGQQRDEEVLSDDEKLEQAAALLAARGHKRTIRALQDTLKELYGKGLNTLAVTQWHRTQSQYPSYAA